MNPLKKHANVRFHIINESVHLSQLYAGFGLLEADGRITNYYDKSPYYQLYSHGSRIITATVNNSIKLAYDMDDDNRIITEVLDWSDFYFKRSYSKAAHEGISAKIQPLGLYYLVYGPRMGLSRRLMKNLQVTRQSKAIDLAKLLVLHSRLLSGLFSLKGGSSVNWYSRFEGSPGMKQDPKVIFMTQVWNTHNISNRQILEERLEINKMRCECIGLLRKEFPKQFFGGIYPSEYALAIHKDFVLPDKRVFHKKNYLTRMHASDIGVSTMGLFGSNGGKLGEYVAAAKAIVTERLRYQVPGDFESGLNYLEFTTPEECVSQVRRLVDNPDLRFTMMQRNHTYYQSCLRPDVLVWNSLQKALGVQ